MSCCVVCVRFTVWWRILLNQELRVCELHKLESQIASEQISRRSVMIPIQRSQWRFIHTGKRGHYEIEIHRMGA